MEDRHKVISCYHLLVLVLVAGSLQYLEADEALLIAAAEPNSSCAVPKCICNDNAADVPVVWENDTIPVPAVYCPFTSLRTVRRESFDRRIKSLYLPDNAITDFAFVAEYPQLEYLNLSVNMLGKLGNNSWRRDIVVQNKALRVLDLSDNDIRHLDRFSICGFVNLTYFYMARNHLTTVADDTFVCLEKLRHLDLRGNELKDVGFVLSKLFYLWSLKTLNLSLNKELEISADLVANTDLDPLELSDSAVESLDVRMTRVQSPSQVSLCFPNIRWLALGGRVPRSLFLGDLVNSNLTSLQTVVYLGVERLEYASDIAEKWPEKLSVHFVDGYLQCECDLWSLAKKFGWERFRATFQGIPCVDRGELEEMDSRCSPPPPPPMSTGEFAAWIILGVVLLLLVLIVALSILYCFRRRRMLVSEVSTPVHYDGCDISLVSRCDSSATFPYSAKGISRNNSDFGMDYPANQQTVPVQVEYGREKEVRGPVEQEKDTEL